MCASEWLLFLSEPLRWVSSPNTNLERQTFFISRQTFFVSRRLSPANVSDLSVRRALNTCGAVTRDRRKWYGCCCYGCWRELWLVIHRRLLHFGEVSFFITFFSVVFFYYLWFVYLVYFYAYLVSVRFCPVIYSSFHYKLCLSVYLVIVIFISSSWPLWFYCDCVVYVTTFIKLSHIKSKFNVFLSWLDVSLRYKIF